MLLFLPVLLLVGVVFVVVPGGFIIVLGGLYYLATGFAGLLGLAATGRWRARASRVRLANMTGEHRLPSGPVAFGPRRAIAPVAVPLSTDRMVRSAPRLVPRRREADDVAPVGPLYRGSAPHRQDGPRPFSPASLAEALPPPLGRMPPSATARKESLARPSSSGSESRA